MHITELQARIERAIPTYAPDQQRILMDVLYWIELQLNNNPEWRIL